MDVLRKELNEIYRAQGLEGERLCEAVFEDCCERVRVYAEVSGKCCVMTDMAADRSFFVAGRCGRMLGLSEAETLTRIIGDILIPQTFSDAIVIPMSATYELQDHVYVSLVNGGRVVKRRIMVSRLSDSHNYIVTSGLTPGDIIIAEAPGLVREGEEIHTQETKGNSAKITSKFTTK